MDVSTAAASSPFELDEPICPYTGLRTFTEAEAIYFRGRESHIARCLALLVAQRFVMITGASGDGKSSLVFAGMLPEVRAGFVPARHSRWAVATFRPERRPLHNLAQALTTALRLPSPEATATELSQGFSSLVALYQASELCQPALPPDNLTPAQRQQQRQAANLLVVVDQFEEFFTNPENYDGDQPNTAAQTTVNLLLETARLAQAQDLPIYIVCTMRSDFVGQCAEFRGLIEQVGASQYFVPRLLRPEFQEVITGPAELSGNRISERLVQRLLYDIGQGQDQLPVLQHALRRIWLAADHGREEMDLIHYAMVGGLADALPPEDQARFAAWRAALPAHQEQFLLGSPGLRNVLDAHANQLYFEASDRYNRDFAPPLPPGTAEHVLEQTFRVLTRTDGKRVVRNRLTGAQLTAILGDAALPWPVVCRILRPFREEGTTFLAPFLGTGDDGRAVLPPEAVLDISHESLIRNWGQLAEWAQLEAKDVHIANDFKQQAGRWLEQEKSRGYLLPIGLYRFFSGWYKTKKGADGWLAYYQSTNPDAALGQGSVATQIQALKSYLAASRRHLWSELLAARYGVWRLVGAILLPVVLLAGGLWWWAQRQEQSDYVANQLMQNGTRQLGKYSQLLKNRAKLLRATRRLDSLKREYKERYGPQPLANKGKFAEQYKRQYPKDSVQYLKNIADLRTFTLPVDDIARFVLTADRLQGYAKDGIYRPWFGTRTAYAFPQLLDTLQNAPAALEVELRMYASADNLDYDQPESENPSARLMLHDLVRRLARAGDITRPIGRSATFSQQRLLAVLTARTVMALSYYLTSDSLFRARVPLLAADQGPHQADRQVLAQQRAQLLRKLRGYIQQETQAATGDAPDTDGFTYCLRVLLGQGHDGPQELAFLERLSPFAAGSRQFGRLLGTPYLPMSYTSAAMVFAALNRPAMVVQCLDSGASVARQRKRYSQLETHFIDLLPYLVKYRLLTAEGGTALLAKVGQAHGVSFKGVYAAAAYSLLSFKPGKAVFQATETSFSATDRFGFSTENYNLQDYAALLGYRGINYSNIDLVSFGLPLATRDTTWAALRAAAQASASQNIFIADDSPKKDTINALFLLAFWAKLHGVYLHEFKHVAAPFGQFAQAYGRLQQALTAKTADTQTAHADTTARPLNRYYRLVNAAEWNLPADGMSGESAASWVPQDPLAYLSLPVRPRTLAFAAYYTCPFDAFFLYQLAQSSAAPALLRSLDSMAFREATFPDRNSYYATASDANGTYRSSLNYHTRYLPNLELLHAMARAGLPSDSTRRRRNAILLAIEETLLDRRKLRDSAHTRRLARWLVKAIRQLQASQSTSHYFKEVFSSEGTARARSLPSYEEFSVAKKKDDLVFTAPLAVALSDLATALAHEGQAAEGYALADALTQFDALDKHSVVPTAIRVSEQVMLTNDRRATTQYLLNSFLWNYLLANEAGRVIDKDDGSTVDVAASIFNLCFWRPLSDKPDSISLIAPSLIYQLYGDGLNIGLDAPFKAGGLADHVYEARQRLENSPFTRGHSHLRHLSYILLGYAHLKTSRTTRGWREYDEAELITPADY